MYTTAVRMPTPINKLFNDESIVIQIVFFICLYVELAMDSMEHRINW